MEILTRLLDISFFNRLVHDSDTKTFVSYSEKGFDAEEEKNALTVVRHFFSFALPAALEQ